MRFNVGCFSLQNLRHPASEPPGRALRFVGGKEHKVREDGARGYAVTGSAHPRRQYTTGP
jgi:hypothetical protein